MFNFSFFKKQKNFLGIDIGTFSIKVAEISEFQNKTSLENYGETFNQVRGINTEGIIEEEAFIKSEEEIASDIKNILRKCKIRTQEAFFSIPDFMSFFTVISTPKATKEELSSIVQFEAKQYIPMPLQEMNLDWTVIEEQGKDDKKETKILLAAVPKKIINKYKKIADLSELKLVGMEAEIFSLARVLLKNEDPKKTYQLIDIGNQSTTITIIQNQLIKATYSINFSNDRIIRNLAKSLNVDYNKAEQLIQKGLEDSSVKQILEPEIINLARESKRVSENFKNVESSRIDKVFLSGGSVLAPGFIESFSEKTQEKTATINPFININYSPEIKAISLEIGSRYSIAIGLALRGLENN